MGYVVVYIVIDRTPNTFGKNRTEPLIFGLVAENTSFRPVYVCLAAHSPWSQRREAKAIVKNVTVQPIKPVYVTLVFVWNSLAGMLLLPKLQLLVCSIILPVVALPAFLCNTVTI